MTTNDLTFQNVRNNYIRCIVYFYIKLFLCNEPILHKQPSKFAIKV